MDKLDGLLKKLNFTQYEAKILDTLIRYNSLSARELQKYSGVPQPKIYETVVKLQERDLVSIIPKGRKKIFMIKPKEVVQEQILKYTRDVNETSKKTIEIIEKIYNSEEAEEVPFVGIAGKEVIQEYIYMLIDTAKESFISYIPINLYNKKIYSLLKKRKNEIDIKFIVLQDDLKKLPEEVKGIPIYKLETPVYDKFKMLSEGIEKFLKPEDKSSHVYLVIKAIILNLRELFGLILVDKKRSLFRIPVPIEIPLAIMATLPELIKFHVKGVEEILKHCEKVDNSF
ncbi:MAG: TrmB family transcriptional regulator [Promethearchaeota archaeon]